jgi:hypothetical protein
MKWWTARRRRGKTAADQELAPGAAGMLGNRRDFFRIAAPAVALPMLASPLQAKEVRLVTREEIMEAYRFFDRMELHAEDLNLRYQILIDMLFETNPENLRAKLQQLRDNRSKRSVLVDADSGQTAPYHPDMYDELGRLQERVVQFRDDPDKPVSHWDSTQLLPKPRLRSRIAGFVRKQLIGV